MQLYKSCKWALYKPYICTTKDEEGYADVSQQKSLLEELNFSQLVLE